MKTKGWQALLYKGGLNTDPINITDDFNRSAISSLSTKLNTQDLKTSYSGLVLNIIGDINKNIFSYPSYYDLITREKIVILELYYNGNKKFTGICNKNNLSKKYEKGIVITEIPVMDLITYLDKKLINYKGASLYTSEDIVKFILETFSTRTIFSFELVEDGGTYIKVKYDPNNFNWQDLPDIGYIQLGKELIIYNSVETLIESDTYYIIFSNLIREYYGKKDITVEIGDDVVYLTILEYQNIIRDYDIKLDYNTLDKFYNYESGISNIQHIEKMGINYGNDGMHNYSYSLCYSQNTKKLYSLKNYDDVTFIENEYDLPSEIIALPSTTIETSAIYWDTDKITDDFQISGSILIDFNYTGATVFPVRHTGNPNKKLFRIDCTVSGSGFTGIPAVAIMEAGNTTDVYRLIFTNKGEYISTLHDLNFFIITPHGSDVEPLDTDYTLEDMTRGLYTYGHSPIYADENFQIFSTIKTGINPEIYFLDEGYFLFGFIDKSNDKNTIKIYKQIINQAGVIKNILDNAILIRQFEADSVESDFYFISNTGWRDEINKYGADCLSCIVYDNNLMTFNKLLINKISSFIELQYMRPIEKSIVKSIGYESFYYLDSDFNLLKTIYLKSTISINAENKQALTFLFEYIKYFLGTVFIDKNNVLKIVDFDTLMASFDPENCIEIDDAENYEIENFYFSSDVEELSDSFNSLSLKRYYKEKLYSLFNSIFFKVKFKTPCRYNFDFLDTLKFKEYYGIVVEKGISIDKDGIPSDEVTLLSWEPRYPLQFFDVC